jgi:hypothetical protein
MALYDAFISYSHAKDKPIATARSRQIETVSIWRTFPFAYHGTERTVEFFVAWQLEKEGLQKSSGIFRSTLCETRIMSEKSPFATAMVSHIKLYD